MCALDDRTLTEMLFNGNTGTIFTCKILSMTTPKYYNDPECDNGIQIQPWTEDGIDGTATVEIIQVYFGKVDTNIVKLKTGTFLQVGKTYLIYTYGNGKTFSCGGNCDKWTKQVADNSCSTYEMQLLKQFSDIFKNKTTGKFTFTNSKGIIIAEGQYRKGKPIKVWKHYYDNGNIKAEYDLKKNVNIQYSANGLKKSSETKTKEKSVYLTYSNKVNGQVKYKFEEFPNDSGTVMLTYSYYDNGILEKVNGQLSIKVKGGYVSAGKTGIYEEYHVNGKLRLKGQYDHNKRIGLWQWYNDNGELNSEFDYKDGKGNQ